MKRMISIFMIVALMLASVLAIIPAAAADSEGVAINTAEEFLAMSADGNYYLAKDITISKAYEAEFAGTLDGNGKTVTVTAEALTMFNVVKGATIKNINVKANYETNSIKTLGLVANKAQGIFANIIVNGNVKVVPANADNDIFKNGAGLVIGEITDASTLSNITTYGAIDVQTKMSTKNDPAGLEYGVGGVAGRALKGEIKFINCINYAYANTLQPGMPVGGILGATAAEGASVQVTFESCVNNGEVATYGVPAGWGNAHTGAGGIIGNALGTKSPNNKFVLKNCRNNGYIHQNEECGKVTGVGGMIGRAYASANLTLENCVNAGKIEAFYDGWAPAGGMIGTNMTYGFAWAGSHAGIVTIKNCINIGEVVAHKAAAAGMLAIPAQFNVKECQLTLQNCVNYGKITGGYASDGAGGMLGRVGTYGFSGLTISNCVNYGDITNTAGGAAGIVFAVEKLGEIYTKGTDPNPTIIENCVNLGKITATGDAAGIVTKVDTNDTTIKNCVSNATYEGTNNAPVMPQSDKTVTAEGNIFLGTDTAAYATAADEATVNAKIAEIVANVPGNPAELDALIATVADYEQADYKAGWDNFETMRAAATVIANRASSVEDINEIKAQLTEAVEALQPIDAVDFSAIDAALEEAAALLEKEADYTPGTWDIFEAAYEAAQGIGDDAKQSAVNKACDALVAAIAGLEKIPDLDALSAAIDATNQLVEAEYVTKTWAVLADALARAEALLVNVNATGSMVDAAIAALNDATAALAKKVDVKPLGDKASATATQYKPEDYTAMSYGKVKSAVEKANDAVAANDISKDDLDALIKAIDDAIAGLEKKATWADTNAFLATVEDLRDTDYTKESWDAYTAALNELKSNMKEDKKPNVSVEDEAKYLAELKAAYEALVAYATYGAIDTRVDELDALDKTKYTAESWKALQDAIKAANALKSDRYATQPQADAALAAINAAVEALVEAGANSGDATTPTTNNGGDATEPEKKGCGGVIATTAVVMTSVLALGAAFVAKKKED